jgi:hypothetical protein
VSQTATPYHSLGSIGMHFTMHAVLITLGASRRSKLEGNSTRSDVLVLAATIAETFSDLVEAKETDVKAPDFGGRGFLKSAANMKKFRD